MNCLKNKELFTGENSKIVNMPKGEGIFFSYDVKEAVQDFIREYKDRHKVCLNPSDLRDNEILLDELKLKYFGDFEE